MQHKQAKLCRNSNRKMPVRKRCLLYIYLLYSSETYILSWQILDVGQNHTLNWQMRGKKKQSWCNPSKRLLHESQCIVLNPGVRFLFCYWYAERQNVAFSKNWASETTQTVQLIQWQQAPGGWALILSTPSACHHPQPENIPFLLASLVGKRQETWLFLELCFLCASVCILVTNRGKLQHLFLFLLPHDTEPVFFGSHTPQILASKFFWQSS